METTNAQGEKSYELPHVIELTNPIEMGKENSIERVTFKNPLTGAMVSELPAGGSAFFKVGHMYPIISKMTGETVVLYNKMIYSDLERCLDVAYSFLTNGPTTGTAE